MTIENGFAVIARSNSGGDYLKSFHATKSLAREAIVQRIDTMLLRVGRAMVERADNGNVRMWKQLPARMK